MKININNSFINNLPADRVYENYCRQVDFACFSYVTPSTTTKPDLIHFSKEVLNILGLSEQEADTDEFLKVFTGNKVLADTHPYAMCYGGHQFGNWAGQLGDGRAINLFEVYHQNKRWAVQLKGAGKTPYSRSADGLAVLRSSIREYLCSEAMHYLNIPSTRALSLALTGGDVLRDVLYNGNPAFEKGAVVCRVAETFIRFGNFEILASKQNVPLLKQLTDYTISYFFKEITSKGKQKYLDFLTSVRNKTIDMIVHWQRVGFVHGVMNTDNMSILGLTIDFGPYGWLDVYDDYFTPNTTDAAHKRYRYENQPYIGMWNLFKLANALYPLIEEVEPVQNIINSYQSIYQKKYKQMMLEKLGLFSKDVSDDFIVMLTNALQAIETDYTIFFRLLINVLPTDTPQLALHKINDAFYNTELLKDDVLQLWQEWFAEYLDYLKMQAELIVQRKEIMCSVNPKYIFRNYMAQMAIEQADKSDYNLIHEFHEMLKNPYDEQPKYQQWFSKRPEWARNKVGCSMLSCSS